MLSHGYRPSCPKARCQSCSNFSIDVPTAGADKNCCAVPQLNKLIRAAWRLKLTALRVSVFIVVLFPMPGQFYRSEGEVVRALCAHRYGEDKCPAKCSDFRSRWQFSG